MRLLLGCFLFLNKYRARASPPVNTAAPIACAEFAFLKFSDERLAIFKREVSSTASSLSPAGGQRC